MKSMMRKAMLIGIAAVLLTSTLTAAPKKGKKDDPYKKIEKQKDPATKKVYDFKGMEIVLGDWWSDPTIPPSSKKQEDDKAWQEWVNQTYNVKCVQKQVAGWGSTPQFVANFCITGGDENYVLCIDGRSANVGIKADLFYDLSKITSVDYMNDPKYDQGITKRLQKGDSYYTFQWVKAEPREGMFYNKKLFEEAGLDPDLPYDMQKDGTWTWETFEELCQKLQRDTDNDGVIDQYAMSSFYTCFGDAALDSNGGSRISRDANGKFYNNAGSDKSMEAWNWMAHMWATYQLPQPEGAAWDYFRTAFINGETAFLADQEFIAQPGGTLSVMKDDFGFVAFPKGPSGDGKYHTLHDSPMWVIPSCYDLERANKIAKAVDLFVSPTPGYDGDDAWKEDYYPGFRDSRAVDETCVLLAQIPNQRVDKLVSGIGNDDMLNPICWGWQTPVEAYESMKNIWQGMLDDVNR